MSKVKTRFHKIISTVHKLLTHQTRLHFTDSDSFFRFTSFFSIIFSFGGSGKPGTGQFSRAHKNVRIVAYRKTWSWALDKAETFHSTPAGATNNNNADKHTRFQCESLHCILTQKAKTPMTERLLSTML